MSHYLKSIMCILELLGDGNKTISITCSVGLDNDDDNELAKKYGV